MKGCMIPRCKIDISWTNERGDWISGFPYIFFQNLADDDFTDIARHGIIEVVGDDVAGRKVIVISACRLPGNKSFDHQRFLR